MDDAQLVQRAATCDKEAFAHVYDRYAPSLHEFLWWVVQDREEADDALYETFVEAGARIHELADPSKLRPWLFAVASREALRRAPRHHHVDAAPVVAPESDTSWSDLVQVVRAVGEELSLRDRALLDLKFRQGLGNDELGAAIGTEPDTAASLVERVAERVEETLGETVVAYLGQKDCPELQDLLGDFDGRLTERQHQIVGHHVQACERCGPRSRKGVGATALLRVTPAAAVPAGVTARVLDDVQLAAHEGRPWPASRDGFPPPLASGERRRWGIAVAAALALLFGTGALIVTRDDGGNTQRVAAVGTTVARSASSTTLRTTTSGASTTTSSSPGDPAAAGAGTGSAAPATTRPAATGTTSGGGGGGGSAGQPAGGTGGGTGGGSGSTSSTTASTVATTTTTTEPPDSTGPSLSGLSVSPSTVRAGGGCTNSDPINTTVSVNASDPSGISSVTATYAGIGGGTYTLGSQGGGTYSATLGPFESPVPPGVNIPPGQVIIRATDTKGNFSTTQASLTLRCTA